MEPIITPEALPEFIDMDVKTCIDEKDPLFGKMYVLVRLTKDISSESKASLRTLLLKHPGHPLKVVFEVVNN